LIALPLSALGACGPKGKSLEVKGTLPAVPADIQRCIKDTNSPLVPDRALTAYDVEKLLKQQSIRIVVAQRCGSRLYNWYMQLRTKWR
jgi:hypothetical protein